MTFEFATASRIIFGAGELSRLGSLAKEHGSNALLMTGKSQERAEAAIQQLQQTSISYTIFSIPQEPTVQLVENAVNKAREKKCDMVISMGGGSVIDAGKAVAGLIANPGEVLDYLEVIGTGKPITEKPYPFIAIPTTAGTGAEVTKNAVLKSTEHNVKVSLRHNLMIPDIALVDPELTYSMPADVTASTGLDALTQLIEPFVSHKATPLTDGVCREGLFRAASSLSLAYHDGSNRAAREDMAIASLFGGLALANAKLGAVHGFAGPLGGMLDAPHGVICARLLPFVIETNLKALQERAPDSPALRRYHILTPMLTKDPLASLEDGINWLKKLCDELNIPSLHQYGMQEKDIPSAVDKAQKSSSMKGNPIELTKDELTTILKKAL